MAQLKVYGWQSFRVGAGSRAQTREIVAARSMAEVARLAGFERPSQLFNLGETGNTREIETATANPGVVFWKPLDPHNATFTADQ